MGEKQQRKTSWCNAANIITFMRFVFMPLIIVFYLLPDTAGGYGKLIAMILFAVAAFTDFLDGFIARRFNMVTDLGKLLDPIADKTLTFLGFLLIFTDVSLIGTLYPVWFAIVIFFIATLRDYITNALRQMAALKNKVMAADWAAKIKSTFQYIGISLAMFYAFALVSINMSGTLETVLKWITCGFLIISAVLSIISGISYIRTYRLWNQE